MAASKIGIVYATGSKMVRRIIVSDTDDELRVHQQVGVGESYLEADPQPGGADVASMEAYAKACIETATGGKCADHVVVVVAADGKAEHFIKADPAIDTMPEKELVLRYSEKIAHGATYDPITGEFTNPARIEKDEAGNDVLIPEEKIEKPQEPVADAKAIQG